MMELYLLLGSLGLMAAIIGHRAWIQGRWRKMEFQKKVAAKLEILKKEELSSGPRRFREQLSHQQKENKLDYAKYKDCLRRAEIALAQNKQKEGENLLIHSLAFAKNPSLALRALARSYQDRGEWKRAQHLYETLLEWEPARTDTYEQLAKIYSKFKRYKEAVAAYVKAVELDEGNDRFLLGLGRLYLLLMRPGLAAECFRRAAELKPREVDTLFLLAESCRADEDFDNALFTYQKILTIEPYNEKAQTALQEVHSKRKEIEMSFQKMMQKQPLKLTLKS